LDSSIVNGSNVIPGGYQGVTGTYQRHNFGWFDNRNGYYLAQSICTVNGQCLIEGFVEENQSKLMVYARSPTLGLTVWVVSGNDARPRAAAMAETAFFKASGALRRRADRSRSTGNRGTGLSPGAWKVDGGLTYLGSQLTDASMDLDVVAIDDNTIVFNVLDSSIVNGSNVIPGGYQGVTGTYQRHNFGWFDNRNGYYLAQSICTVNGQCLTEAFFEENQSKLMVYARSPTLGLTVWLVSGNDAAPRAAAMVETSFYSASRELRRKEDRSRSTGNRGTGLSPGAWKVDGGFKYLGQTLVDADLDLDIVAIDDNTLVGNILDSSIVNGSNVIPGGYQGVTGTYQRHNFGWFDNRNGYYLAQSICTVNGQCLIEGFVEENQSKLMVYARSPTLGLTVWVVSGNDARPRAAAMAETESKTSEGAGTFAEKGCPSWCGPEGCCGSSCCG